MVLNLLHLPNTRHSVKFKADMVDDNLRIQRRKQGKGFSYFYDSGRKLSSQRALKRISTLAIPPNWKDVRIAHEATADLQATGYDVKGRKQYIYHPDWQKARQEEKFSKLVQFSDVLPEFRKECWSLVDIPGWKKEKSLALVCLMLDHTGLRAGNKYYTQQNQTFGLTTLRRQHLEQEGQSVSLSFTGKHGKDRHVDITDPRLAELVCDSAQAQGYAIFRYKSADGRWQDVDSGDVNQFIHSHAGDDFTCKDFRTWGASRYGLASLPDVEQLYRGNKRRRWDTTFVKHIATMLGNTPAICRQYYIHPKLISRFEEDQNRQEALGELETLQEQKSSPHAALNKLERYLTEVISA